LHPSIRRVSQVRRPGAYGRCSGRGPSPETARFLRPAQIPGFVLRPAQDLSDEPRILSLLHSVLRTAGLEAVSAKDGMSAVNLLKT